MFDILFRWRKASKCKNLVRRLHCRLKFLKIKRESIVMQLRDQIAQLLRNGHYEITFSRVEQLCKDQDLLVAYDLLEHFCEFIIIHLPYICKHKNCPNDINEAVSTLIYAAAWCGDLPELQIISKLFGEWYGRKFAKAAAELLPGTLVNSQIRQKLCMKSITENVKLKLMDEIAKDYNLQQELLGSSNSFEPHLQKLCGSFDCQWEGFVFKEEAEINYNSLGGAQMLALYTDDKIIERSFNSNPEKLIIEPLQVTAMHRSTLQIENCAQHKRGELANQAYSKHHSSGPGPWHVTTCFGNSFQSCPSQALRKINVSNGEYYEETFEDFSQDQKFICHQSGYHDKHPRRMSNQMQYTGKTEKHISCNKIQRPALSSQCKYEHRKSFCRCRFSQEMDLNCSLERPCYYNVLEFHNDFLVNKCRKLGKAEFSDFSGSFSREPSPDKEPEPSKRSINSFHSHVHPKLPDYDELAAKFKALKKEHQQRTAKESQGLNVMLD